MIIYAYLAIGLILVLIPIPVILLEPTLFAKLEFFLRVVASLGGALIGAALPGMLQVRLPYAKAAGALAVFLLIFVADPPRLTEIALQPDLEEATESFVEVASEYRDNRTIRPNTALPNRLVTARFIFEQAWSETGLESKKRVPAELISEALSLNNRLYRLQEIDSRKKASASYWAKEAVEYFRETNHSYYLVEALLDQAAIYLQISQLEHTDGEEFRSLSREGDAVLADAFTASDETQRPAILRMWSRFYYNLARPKSNQLSEKWDSDYLALSYKKAHEAFTLAPSDIKNATQLARSTQRAAANPPFDKDAGWTEKLQKSRDDLRMLWSEVQTVRTSPMERIPPLNILAVMTLELAQRRWDLASDAQRQTLGPELLRELNELALPTQREVLGLIAQTELKREFDFDIRYDLARIQSLKVQMLTEIDRSEADSLFDEVIVNLERARDGASTTQLDAAYRSIDIYPAFSGLSDAYRTRLKQVLAIK